MHTYYRKNQDRLHKMVNEFMGLIRAELEQTSGRPYDDLLAEIWNVYQTEMMEHFPYIGGDEASGTKNLTGAYVFVAMGEVLKKYDADMEQIGKLMVLAYERYTLKMPRLIRKLMETKNPCRISSSTYCFASSNGSGCLSYIPASPAVSSSDG